MSNLYREPSIDASNHVSYHLAKQFQRKSCFRNQPIRNNNCLWRPCLLTDQNGMSISHRGPSIDASYHVSVHLAKLFPSKRVLEIDQSETRIACGSIYGKVSIWLLISSQSVNKHGHHIQFLFPIGWFLWKVLCKDYSFCPDPLANMTTTGNSCFWLVDF
jgi:hypothetical protein